jgi:hypothetical protein
MEGAQIRLAHQPPDAVLAAGLSRLTQIEEDAGGAVDAVTRDERRPNQTKQPGILCSGHGIISNLLHQHEHARKPANRGGAVAGNLSQDRRDPTGHLAAPVALDEEPEVIDDLQLWPALAALLALRVHHGVVQRNDANCVG